MRRTLTRRPTIAVLTAAALAAGAGASTGSAAGAPAAAPSAGAADAVAASSPLAVASAARRYRGRTSQRRGITFVLNNSRVSGLRFSFRARCGRSRITRSVQLNLRLRVSRGRFRISRRAFGIAGTIRGRRASGSARVRTYTSAGSACSTARFTWSARA